jgi:two-component system, NarL family, nitrate/nitrite response regulator NarL
MARDTASSSARHGEPPAVVLASSSSALRRRWLEELAGALSLAEAVDRHTLDAVLETSPSTVVFLDLALPGLGGLDGVSDVQRAHPATRIVVLASAPSEGQAVFALVAGARGYCDRNIAPSLVRKAADVVQRGEIWIGRHVVPHLLRRITSLSPEARALPTRVDFLAPRERQIALLVGAGANNKEIASRLNITEATVKAHLTSVFRKLNVSDRLRLALFVTGQRPKLPRAPRGHGTRAPRPEATWSEAPRPADA